MRHANALQVLRHDHRELQSTFHKFENAGEREQGQLCREIVDRIARRKGGPSGPDPRYAQGRRHQGVGQAPPFTARRRFCRGSITEPVKLS